MFIIKFWAFYNGGQGLFIDVDFFFFLVGALGMFLQPIPPSKQKETIFGITHKIPNIQKTSYTTYE